MTNYERIRYLGVEEMAKDRIRCVNGLYLCYSVYRGWKWFESYREAIAHEIDWLNAEEKERAV